MDVCVGFSLLTASVVHVQLCFALLPSILQAVYSGTLAVRWYSKENGPWIINECSRNCWWRGTVPHRASNTVQNFAENQHRAVRFNVLKPLARKVHKRYVLARSRHNLKFLSCMQASEKSVWDGYLEIAWPWRNFPKIPNTLRHTCFCSYSYLQCFLLYFLMQM